MTLMCTRSNLVVFWDIFHIGVSVSIFQFRGLLPFKKKTWYKTFKIGNITYLVTRIIVTATMYKSPFHLHPLDLRGWPILPVVHTQAWCGTIRNYYHNHVHTYYLLKSQMIFMNLWRWWHKSYSSFFLVPDRQKILCHLCCKLVEWFLMFLFCIG
jgi:hypothetical protein